MCVNCKLIVSSILLNLATVAYCRLNDLRVFVVVVVFIAWFCLFWFMLLCCSFVFVLVCLVVCSFFVVVCFLFWGVAHPPPPQILNACLFWGGDWGWGDDECERVISFSGIIWCFGLQVFL